MTGRLSYMLLLISLLAGPSVVTATVAEILGDPRLRPMSVNEARLAATDAEIESDGPYVRVRIFWRGPAPGYPSPGALGAALRRAFEAKGIGVHVAVIPQPRGAPTTLDIRAGRNAFGPVPVADAARQIAPASAAARMSPAPGRPRLWRW